MTMYSARCQKKNPGGTGVNKVGHHETACICGPDVVPQSGELRRRCSINGNNDRIGTDEAATFLDPLRDGKPPPCELTRPPTRTASGLSFSTEAYCAAPGTM